MLPLLFTLMMDVDLRRPVVDPAQVYKRQLQAPKKGDKQDIAADSYPDLTVFNGCHRDGTSKDKARIASDHLRNRWKAPWAELMDKRASFAGFIAPGNDTSRFDQTKAGTVEGWVRLVKQGGKTETGNCGNSDLNFSDAHIEIVPWFGDPDPAHRVIVEITPRVRYLAALKGWDWTTPGLQKALTGKLVRFTGWLYYDEGWKTQSALMEKEGLEESGAEVWRATCWEIHPITCIEILDDKP